MSNFTKRLCCGAAWLATCATVWSATPSARVQVKCKPTVKLASELAAAVAADAKLVGRTAAGEAVLELPTANTDTAKGMLQRAMPGAEVRNAAAEFDPIDRLIVFYEPSSRPTQAELEASGLKVIEYNDEGHFVVCRGTDGIKSASIRALESVPSVTRVEPDYVVRIIPPAENAAPAAVVAAGVSPAQTPNDPDYSNLWGMQNIHAPAAWNTVTSTPIIVAVIDTGVDYNHPDLKTNMWKNPGEIPGDGIDNDGNGIIDDVYGADFINHDGDPMDDNKHGTHCSGTIMGAGNNGVGVAGVTWSGKIMALKFLSAGGSGNVSDAVKAVDYARVKGARVMSNSWGGGGASTAMQDAITRAEQAGMLFIAAAGNGGTNNDAVPFYPASYPNDNIIAVAAIDSIDALAPFSQYGKTSVDLGAPGVNVYSTVPSSAYATLSGTSMATPHVSGAAALIWGHVSYSGANWKTVKKLLLDNARPISALSGKCVSNGTLDIGFLEQAQTTCCGVEAYVDAYNVDIASNQTLASVQFVLPTTMFVHFSAQATAKLVHPAGAANVTTGLYTSPSPNVIYTHSLRRIQFDVANDVQPIGTTFGMRLGPGVHTVYWNVWVSGAEVLTDSATLMVEAFGEKGGGILELQRPELDTVEVQPDGAIVRRVVETLDGTQ